MIRFQLSGCRTACDQLALLVRRDRHVVDALFLGQRDLDRHRRGAVTWHFRLPRPKLPSPGIEQLNLDLRLVAVGWRQAVRLDQELHRLAGREHQTVPLHPHAQQVARRAHHQQPVAAVVQLLGSGTRRPPSASGTDIAAGLRRCRRPTIAAAAWPSQRPRPADRGRRSLAGCVGG